MSRLIKGRLAGAVGPDDRDELAGAHRETHPVQGLRRPRSAPVDPVAPGSTCARPRPAPGDAWK